MMYERQLANDIAARIAEPRRHMQVVIGPRQTGKSTAVSQALGHVDIPSVTFSFDRPRDARARKLEEVWEEGRALASAEGEAVLFLDEVQKVRDWSGTVKALWDEDGRTGSELRVVLAGSSSLLVEKGLADSLAGRFEMLRSTHWSLAECREAFGCSLEDYLYHGGFPGGAPLWGDEVRWRDYIQSSIIDTTLDQDVLQMETVRKPALLRALFEVGSVYSAQEVSYRKLLGQLDDRGNTETIAHYLELLDAAGLISGLQKYSGRAVVTRASSPRLMVHDTALMTASLGLGEDELLGDAELRGHLVETAVGAHLIARSRSGHFDVRWWREGNSEVDFVVTKGRKRTAIEVKSGRVKKTRGLGAFAERFPGTYTLVIGTDECPLEDFLLEKVGLFQ